MFKSGVTRSVYYSFVDSFQSFGSQKSDLEKPYVYVDSNGIKLITDVVNEYNENASEIFAVSVAEDGWMEFLALYDK